MSERKGNAPPGAARTWFAGWVLVGSAIACAGLLAFALESRVGGWRVADCRDRVASARTARESLSVLSVRPFDVGQTGQRSCAALLDSAAVAR